MTDYFDIKNEIKKLIKGDVLDDNETLKKYSRDASLLEVWPKLVIYPRDPDDIKKIVKFVSEKKHLYPDLSITARAAGTCMSGGPLGESIILDVTKYFNKFSINKIDRTAEVEPGVFYRDFEEASLKQNLILPCYTASKNLCAFGGMLANNCAGEKTLKYGKMENFVQELTVLLKDGNEYTFKAVSRYEVIKKSHEHTFEGEVYQMMSALIEENREEINRSKPKVSKNSAGYYLWNIEKNAMFDLTKILVGSQGTLGVITKAKIKLEEIKEKSKLLVIFLSSTQNLGDIVNEILKHNPESLESYDDATFKLAIRFLPEIISHMKSNFFKLLIKFLPETFMAIKGGIPKLILLVEFSDREEGKVDMQIDRLMESLEKFSLKMRKSTSVEDSEKYWTIRRESFNLLRKHMRGKRTAPFIDDVCIEPKHLPEFLPRLKKILDREKLVYTIAGHAGNGNFHVIPLMDFRIKKNRDLVLSVSEEVYNLVKEYEGSITAEHNDGIIRTPYLEKMFSQNILKLFEKTKKIFDPQNIFNPGKKVGGGVEYIREHIAKN